MLKSVLLIALGVVSLTLTSGCVVGSGGPGGPKTTVATPEANPAGLDSGRASDRR